MREHGRPEVILTDKLRFYVAALKEIGAGDRQEMGRWLNNPSESSQLAFRRRERSMLRFRPMRSLQKFAAAHASVSNHFNQKLNLSGRPVFLLVLTFKPWRRVRWHVNNVRRQIEGNKEVRRAILKGVGHYLPERVFPNSEFEKTLDTSDAWIRSRSGIERRHFAAEGETTSMLASEAGHRALAAAGVKASDLDCIVLATSTADLTFPSASTMVQHALGMTRGFAFDVQAVCAGFVYALANANAIILSGQADRVLVIGAETFSQIMDWTDRSTCVLFGDGAGAIVLEASEGAGTSDDRGILATDLHSDGRFRDLLYVDGGVSTGTSGVLRMQGKEVFRHAVEKLAATAEAALAKAELGPDDVDWVVPHQANIRIIQPLAEKLGVPMDRVVVTIQEHGNTSAASIPLALSLGVERGQIKSGDLVVSVAVGGGLAWGAAALRW